MLEVHAKVAIYRVGQPLAGFMSFIVFQNDYRSSVHCCSIPPSCILVWELNYSAFTVQTLLAKNKQNSTVYGG